MPSMTKRPERNPVLGIEFGHDQIRAVEVRHDGAKATITAAGSIAMPMGALDPGSTITPDLVGQRVKSLLRQMGATTRNAVLGVPSTGVFTRLLDLPRVPDAELDAIVAGEVAHYQMIRLDGGAYGYAPLPAPETAREQPVLVMAADDPILHALDVIAKTAGLGNPIREPSQLGSVRAALAQAASEPVLYISISDGASEIAVVENQRLGLYRRIDVAARNLVAAAARVATVPEGPESAPAQIDEVLAARLATEVRRSLDFYRRQFPQVDVNQAIVTVSGRDLEPMVGYLGGSLGMETKLAQATVDVAPTAAAETGTPVGQEYMGALGLALGEFGHGSQVLPRFDLVPSAPRASKVNSESKAVALSVAASVLILAIGVALWNSTRSKADAAERRAVVLREDVQTLKRELEPKQQRKDMEMKVLADLARQGVPFPWVMDEVTAALDPGVGVSEIHFDQGRIRLVGDAKNEASMISTVDRLRAQGTFQSTIVDQFSNDRGEGLRFNVSSGFEVRNQEQEGQQ